MRRGKFDGLRSKRRCSDVETNLQVSEANHVQVSSYPHQKSRKANAFLFFCADLGKIRRASHNAEMDLSLSISPIIMLWDFLPTWYPKKPKKIFSKTLFPTLLTSLF